MRNLGSITVEGQKFGKTMIDFTNDVRAQIEKTERSSDVNEIVLNAAKTLKNQFIKMSNVIQLTASQYQSKITEISERI
jgi:hypothetical protein